MCECYYIFRDGSWVCRCCGTEVSASIASDSNASYLVRHLERKCYCQDKIHDMKCKIADAVGCEVYEQPINKALALRERAEKAEQENAELKEKANEWYEDCVMFKREYRAEVSKKWQVEEELKNALAERDSWRARFKTLRAKEATEPKAKEDQKDER